MTSVAAPSSPAATRQPSIARLARVSPATVATQVVGAAVIAAIAVSRAAHGELSSLALTGLVAGAAAAGAFVAWPIGIVAGAQDVLDRSAPPDCDAQCPGALDHDPLAAPRVWRRAALLSLLVGAWAFASAGMMAIALNGRAAQGPVVLASLLGVGAVSSVVVDAAARHRGAHLVDRAAPSHALRRHAWLDVAVPLGVSQVLTNVGAAWVLFHDDVRDPFADAGVVVTVLALLFAVGIAAPWGALEARLGRVELDDERAQRTAASAPFGPQAIVYLALVGLVLAQGIDYLLPSAPTLTEVLVARGLFAGVLVTGYTAIGYARGALNAEAGA